LAAHWKYKTGENDETELDRWMKTIKELLENPEPSAIDFIDTFKLNLFASEIFVFTPKGEIKTIPHGSTALDFAFVLHSNIGEHCIGAKVNHKLVPLNHALQSGDQVEILTSKKQTPQTDWLNFVTTAKARAKLKAYFRKDEKAAVAIGQKKIEESLALIELQPDNENIVKILNHYKFSSRNNLYLQAGNGNLDLDDITKVIFKPKNKNVFSRYFKFPFVGNSEKGVETKIEMVPSQRVDRKKTFILTEENADLSYKFAPCCKPIPGDDVLGYVDENEIVIVHKRECKVAARIKTNFGNQIVSASWATHKSMYFHETIEIIGIDKKGVMVEILRIISEQYGVNISKMIIETNAGIFTGLFDIFVHDKQEIENLCKNINKIPEVNSTQRVQNLN
jgi:GTP pyrophosphokinase